MQSGREEIYIPRIPLIEPDSKSVDRNKNRYWGCLIIWEETLTSK